MAGDKPRASRHDGPAKEKLTLVEDRREGGLHRRPPRPESWPPDRAHLRRFEARQSDHRQPECHATRGGRDTPGNRRQIDGRYFPSNHFAAASARRQNNIPAAYRYHLFVYLGYALVF